MAKYTVGITGRIYVVAEVEVEAENKEQAKELAMQKASELLDSGDWDHYTSIPDSDTLQVEDVTDMGRAMRDESKVANYLRKRGWQYAYSHKRGMFKIVKWRHPRDGVLYSQGHAQQIERANDRAHKLAGRSEQ